ncbi:hypothetical protein BDA96_05G093200 [Sorghum bicolor]|uniref:Uncharacterized protein n=2 Tax=Sorghum bicolor TaxID=4558 RepID=A0A921QYC1_SORBI|nr:hypothetical protein BDA96_05G093200 [Sorghum bicolor]
MFWMIRRFKAGHQGSPPRTQMHYRLHLIQPCRQEVPYQCNNSRTKPTMMK